MIPAMVPQTRYARSGDVNIAYQVVGDGPRDLILVPGWMSNIEVFWDEPAVGRFLRRLASFSRLILFDKRGTGLSDRVGSLPDLETRMDDVRAVMDAVGSRRAALCGYSEGAAMCMLFAATYPARTTALIAIAGYARQRSDPDYPWGRDEEQQKQFLDAIEKGWGGPVGLDLRAPSLAHDEHMRQWWSRFLRMSASPAAALALSRMNYEIDVRHILPAIHVPTLMLHAVGDRAVDVHASRYMAERIAGTKLIELPGNDHLPWGSDVDAIVDEIEEFLTGERHGTESDRILATILFTDIVESTARAADLGDQRWRDLLESFYGAVRRELSRFRGIEVATVGDGMLATFDGPARGVRCALSIASAALPLGIKVRTGLHTGEYEVIENNVGGIAVHTAARVATKALPGEVLVSQTVKDLVAGSGIRFESRGTHPLKGVPGEWTLFAAIS
jgi:pimeloyl-ACP methyl ester carboxylesterase